MTRFLIKAVISLLMCIKSIKAVGVTMVKHSKPIKVFTLNLVNTMSEEKFDTGHL